MLEKNTKSIEIFKKSIPLTLEIKEIKEVDEKKNKKEGKVIKWLTTYVVVSKILYYFMDIDRRVMVKLVHMC